VETELNYLVPMAEKPCDYAYDPPQGVPRHNTRLDARRVTIRDARAGWSMLSLDVQGFAAVRRRSASLDFDRDEEIRRIYYPESEALLREVTGATRVFIFDHTIRRREGVREPVLEVHVDQTVKSGPQRVRDLLPAEAEELLAGRVQIINLWRPIRGPVRELPLAVCDARSVAAGDLVAADLVYRDRIGETYAVTYNADHRWFYLSEMTTEEALLVKCFDSETDGRARFAPHSAFVDPTTPPDSAPRESIELRTLVFHKA
jgi:hypothetical protein